MRRKCIVRFCTAGGWVYAIEREYSTEKFDNLLGCTGSIFEEIKNKFEKGVDILSIDFEDVEL